jgi:membrane protease YdiL (CAAX protease family)
LRGRSWCIRGSSSSERGSRRVDFIFAVVMSLIVTYSRSLWASIIAHSANDCLSFVIFGV